jgi:hypothetical protein
MGSQHLGSMAMSRRASLSGAAAPGAAAVLPARPAAAKSAHGHAGGERFQVSLSVPRLPAPASPSDRGNR